MKRTLLAIISVLTFSVGAIAQLSLEKENVTVRLGYTDFEKSVYVKIYNNSTSEECTVSVERFEKDVVFGASNYFCFGQTCYPATTNKSSDEDQVVISEEGQNTSFSAYYQPRNKAGVSEVDYVFENVNDASENATLTIVFDASEATVGINENEAIATVNAFYSQKNKNITLSYDNLNGSGNLVIRNIAGKVVFSDAVVSGTGVLVIPSDNLAPGIHIVALTGENGETAINKLSIY